ncbi:MAG: hypothetical protein IPH26_03480 [Sterolibacteriaceae bacterium]|uniref:Uncharacterized protein n=1 Tax=Candidatus Methylophosphatis roskildensis TaxID=2899263 RepID=A0A9D7E0S5_9PROT|nr:hypothetical protein [Candidatus Methylophosphatis roskildensis]
MNLNYHPVRDFAAVIPIGVTPNVFVVPPAKGFKTVGEFVAAAKAKPGAMNFASAGVGLRLISARNDSGRARESSRACSAQGRAEIITEVMTGRVDFSSGRSGSWRRTYGRASSLRSW